MKPSIKIHVLNLPGNDQLVTIPDPGKNISNCSLSGGKSLKFSKAKSTDLYFHSSLALCLGLLSVSSCRNGGQESDKTDKRLPNIVFIAVDDLRPELGCYGNTIVKSPNIDRLASQSVIFRRAYCNVPVSGASRASLLTGTRPTSYRFLSFDTWAEKDYPEAVTLPEYFRRNGYHTVSLSKVFHHQHDSRKGWDVEWRPAGKGTWRNYLTEENLKIDTLIKRGMPFECADVPDTSYFDGQTALMAIKHLRDFRDSGKPFFLAAGFLKPHLPFNAPKKYWDMYDPETIGVADNPYPPEDAPNQAVHQWGELRNYYSIPEKGPLTDSAANKLRHGYYACVSYTDALVGMVLNELKNCGLEDNTIIVLWGDHGWNLGEHGMWCKHCNFNTSLNAPLIIKVPGLTEGEMCNNITEFIDIYPTLCELSGLPIPSHLEGESLLKRLKNPRKQENDFAVCKFNNGVTLVEKNLFYTEWINNRDSIVARMLYDHDSDPDENTNLSEKQNYSAVATTLSSVLREKRGTDFLRQD